MIYRLTLLRNLPEAEAGFSFYLKGGLASEDGEDWFSWITRDSIYTRMYHLFWEERHDWVLVEDSNIPDNRYDLQDCFPDHRLLGFKEALDSQGFIYDESSYGINNIRCCGEQLKMLGATKADCIYCSNCGKGVQDAVNYLVWGLKDVPPPRTYLYEFRYDPFKKYLAGIIKDENLKKD